jgi:hypothetical protein
MPVWRLPSCGADGGTYSPRTLRLPTASPYLAAVGCWSKLRGGKGRCSEAERRSRDGRWYAGSEAGAERELGDDFRLDADGET